MYTLAVMCPSASPPGSRVGVCAELCSSDDDCALDEKCCSNGCGHQCTKGVLCAVSFQIDIIIIIHINTYIVAGVKYIINHSIF